MSKLNEVVNVLLPLSALALIVIALIPGYKKALIECEMKNKLSFEEKTKIISDAVIIIYKR